MSAAGKIQKVVAYCTSDGTSFSEEDDANKHQMHINIINWCVENGIGKGGEWTTEMVADVIYENRDSLRRTIG